MSSRIDRFNKRRAIKKSIQNRPLNSVAGIVDQDDIDQMLNKGFDQNKIDKLNYSTALTSNFAVDPREARELLESLRQEFNHERFEGLVLETRRDVMFAIAGPFGLGKILSAFDKNGGNVTTVHNAKQGIYANQSDEYDRNSYDRTKNSEGMQFSGSGKNSVGSNYTRSQMDSDGMVRDEYTGKTQKADTTSPDHIHSLSDFHKEGGFMLDSQKKADFATDTGNLAQTDRSINQSMQDTDKEVWMDKTSTKDKNSSNAEYYDVDEKAVKEAVQRGRETADKHLPTTSEKASYYAKNTVKSGMNEGMKMGLQQAVGLLMVEFFSQVFHEASLAFNKGLEGSGLIDDLRIRFKRVAKKVSEKWKDVTKAFSEGFFSGFISNLVTTAINMVKTTSAKVVRLIREGIFSLFKALKMILFKPKEMSRSQSLHEALKIIFAGGIIIAGVALEDTVSAMIAAIPILTPFAPLLTAAIIGSLTALASALVAYLLDKLDLFGAIRVEQNKFIIERLDSDINASLARSEKIAKEMDEYLLLT